jgi:hypothetical protein
MNKYKKCGSVQGGAQINFADPEVQVQMDESLQAYRSSEYVMPETISSFWEALKDSNNGSAPGVRPRIF